MTYIFINADHTLVKDDNGWSGLFSAIPEGSIVAEYIPPVEAIAPVTPRQIRLALTFFGLRDTVETAVNAATIDVQDWYHYALAFDRDSPIVASMAVALSITSTQLDELWKKAATL